MKRVLLFILIGFGLIGCDSSSSSVSSIDENSSNFSKQNKSISIDGTQKVYRVANAKSTNIELNIKDKKDIYVVVTSRFNNQNISISTTNSTFEQKSSSRVLNQDISNNTPLLNRYNTVLMRKEVNNILFSLKAPRYRQTNITKSQRAVAQNTSANFCIGMDSNYNCSEYIGATTKKIVKDIDTAYGKKTLVIWLEDGNSLSQSSIDELSGIFLKSGGSNDIYDWVTNIFGKEWGSDAEEIDAKLIANSDVIDILIYDMNNYGLAGYYWGKDNFKKSSIDASNEKVMFYLNSELLKKNPKETYTTLTHEFQHMIHFYQRSVRKGIEDSAWYDELMAESIEDLISTKIEYMGPRNVSPYDGTAGSPGNKGGRFPTFNKYNTVSLTTWQNSTQDYSKVSAFGTYLLRNYDGAALLNRMMYSENQDEYAILDATKESSFAKLIADWGSAVMLSDIINPGEKYTYNFGDFKYSSFNGTIYEMGSINFFNYAPNPLFKSSAILDKNANLYYKVGSNLRGIVNLNINIPNGADITIIAK